jgi:hypothetical protein
MKKNIIIICLCAALAATIAREIVLTAEASHVVETVTGGAK